MAADPDIFPDALAIGFSGGPEDLVHVATTAGGFEKRNIAWSRPRWGFEAAREGMTAAAWAELLAWFAASRGEAHAFLLRDPLDNALDRQEIGTTDGATAAFQAYKRYARATRFVDRVLTRPAAGAASVWVNGAAIAEGAGAGEFEISATTGIVTLGATLAATSGQAVELALTTFYVPVRFAMPKLAGTHDDAEISEIISAGSLTLIEVRE